MFKAIDISYSGLSTYKQMLEVTANNITNIDTTRTPSGGPYKRQAVILEPKQSFDDFFNNQPTGGVQVKSVVQDNKVNTVYNPTSPDADANGYVRMPNIQLTAEMTNMMEAQRGYDMSATVLNATKDEIQKESQIGQ